MRIVTWNCAGALRKKTHALAPFYADVLVIQECEDPAQSVASYRDWAGTYAWKGLSKNKGIGVFVRKQQTLSVFDWNRSYTLPEAPNSSTSATWKTDELREFLPVRIDDKFNLIAVWTKQSQGGTFGYAGQLWKYLQSHLCDMAADECMLIGDLNSNVRWDRADRWWNHSDNVEILAGIGMQSLYHDQMNLPQGNEVDPTFYLHRNLAKPYHIDYVFASTAILSCAKMMIHSADDWLEYSDHMPIVVDLEL